MEADAFMCPQLGSVIFQLNFIGHQTHLSDKRQNKDTCRFLLIIIIIEIVNISPPLKSVSIYFLQDVVNYKKIDVTWTRYLSNTCS